MRCEIGRYVSFKTYRRCEMLRLCKDEVRSNKTICSSLPPSYTTVCPLQAQQKHQQHQHSRSHYHLVHTTLWYIALFGQRQLHVHKKHRQRQRYRHHCHFMMPPHTHTHPQSTTDIHSQSDYVTDNNGILGWLLFMYAINNRSHSQFTCYVVMLYKIIVSKLFTNFF